MHRGGGLARSGEGRRARLIAAVAGILVAGAGAWAGITLGAQRQAPSSVADAGAADAPQHFGSATGHPASPQHHATTVANTSGGCVRVPILAYHYIRLVTSKSNLLGYELSVSPAEFGAQMDWLRAAGGHPVSLAQVLSAMQGGPPLPPHAVVLTFDDGYEDFATTAAPILARDGFVGTSFVVSGFIGRPAYMTQQQVLQVASLGMVIGAHTVDHVNLAALPPNLASIEIAASKRALELLVHHQVVDFAYPYGNYTATTAALVAQSGFADAVTLMDGDAQCNAQRYELHRLRVTGDDTVWTFAHLAGVAVPPPGWTDPNYAPVHRV